MPRVEKKLAGQKRLAVAIVGYNSQTDLADCLGSLLAIKAIPMTVFYINNSQDNSELFVKKNFPAVQILKSQGNVGFAKANNIIAAAAIKQGSSHLFLLNPDTVVDSRCLERLIAASDTKTILQPLILLFNKKKTDLVNTSGNTLHYLGVSYVGGYKQPKDSKTWKADLAIASGAAMVVPLAIINKIGLFEKSFFMYHEDVDFSWRARIAGYSIQLIPEALVWHKYHFSRNKEKFFYAERNRLRFIARNYQPKTLWLISPMLVLNELLMVCYSLIAGWFPQKLRANFSALLFLSEDFRFRRQLRRVVNDASLKQYFSTRLGFSEIRIPLINAYNQLLRGYWRLVRRWV